MYETLRNRVSLTAGLKQEHQQGAQAAVSQRARCRALWGWSAMGCSKFAQAANSDVVEVREPHCVGR